LIIYHINLSENRVLRAFVATRKTLVERREGKPRLCFQSFQVPEIIVLQVFMEGGQDGMDLFKLLPVKVHQYGAAL
jgi:hypothetical protein